MVWYFHGSLPLVQRYYIYKRLRAVWTKGLERVRKRRVELDCALSIQRIRSNFPSSSNGKFPLVEFWRYLSTKCSSHLIRDIRSRVNFTVKTSSSWNLHIYDNWSFGRSKAGMSCSVVERVLFREDLAEMFLCPRSLMSENDELTLSLMAAAGNNYDGASCVDTLAHFYSVNNAESRCRIFTPSSKSQTASSSCGLMISS